MPRRVRKPLFPVQDSLAASCADRNYGRSSNVAVGGDSLMNLGTGKVLARQKQRRGKRTRYHNEQENVPDFARMITTEKGKSRRGKRSRSRTRQQQHSFSVLGDLQPPSRKKSSRRNVSNQIFDVLGKASTLESFGGEDMTPDEDVVDVLGKCPMPQQEKHPSSAMAGPTCSLAAFCESDVGEATKKKRGVPAIASRGGNRKNGKSGRNRVEKNRSFPRDDHRANKQTIMAQGLGALFIFSDNTRQKNSLDPTTGSPRLQPGAKQDGREDDEESMAGVALGVQRTSFTSGGRSNSLKEEHQQSPGVLAPNSSILERCNTGTVIDAKLQKQREQQDGPSTQRVFSGGAHLCLPRARKAEDVPETISPNKTSPEEKKSCPSSEIGVEKENRICEASISSRQPDSSQALIVDVSSSSQDCAIYLPSPLSVEKRYTNDHERSNRYDIGRNVPDDLDQVAKNEVSPTEMQEYCSRASAMATVATSVPRITRCSRGSCSRGTRQIPGSSDRGAENMDLSHGEEERVLPHDGSPVQSASSKGPSTSLSPPEVIFCQQCPSDTVSEYRSTPMTRPSKCMEQKQAADGSIEQNATKFPQSTFVTRAGSEGVSRRLFEETEIAESTKSREAQPASTSGRGNLKESRPGCCVTDVELASPTLAVRMKLSFLAQLNPISKPVLSSPPSGKSKEIVEVKTCTPSTQDEECSLRRTCRNLSSSDTLTVSNGKSMPCDSQNLEAQTTTTSSSKHVSKQSLSIRKCSDSRQDQQSALLRRSSRVRIPTDRLKVTFKRRRATRQQKNTNEKEDTTVQSSPISKRVASNQSRRGRGSSRKENTAKMEPKRGRRKKAKGMLKGKCEKGAIAEGSVEHQQQKQKEGEVDEDEDYNEDEEEDDDDSPLSLLLSKRIGKAKTKASGKALSKAKADLGAGTSTATEHKWEEDDELPLALALTKQKNLSIKIANKKEVARRCSSDGGGGSSSDGAVPQNHAQTNCTREGPSNATISSPTISLHKTSDTTSDAARVKKAVGIAESKKLESSHELHDNTMLPLGLEWTLDEMENLQKSYRESDPTMTGFWEKIAIRVGGKTAEECQDKWFSKVGTPKNRRKKEEVKNRSKHAKNRRAGPSVDYDDEDDIFDSTPLRSAFAHDAEKGGFYKIWGGEDKDYNSCSDGENSEVSLPLQCDFGSPISHSSGYDTNVGAALSPLRFRTGYKGYIKKFAKLQKVPRGKSGKIVHDTNFANLLNKKRERPLSAAVGAGDVEMSGKLSPGGTLKVQAPTDSDLEDLVIHPGDELSEEEDEIEKENARLMFE